jgi:hypothetical protein
MPLNLGATDAVTPLAADGLFYQWGRKDPFPGGRSGSAGYEELDEFTGIGTAVTLDHGLNDLTAAKWGIVQSIKRPTTFFSTINIKGQSWLPWLQEMVKKLWCTDEYEKTIYDPCPEGYRVSIGSGFLYAPSDKTQSPYYSGIMTLDKGEVSGYKYVRTTDVTGTGTEYFGFASSWRENSGGWFNNHAFGIYRWTGQLSVYDNDNGKIWLYNGNTGTSGVAELNCAMGLNLRCSVE